MLAPMEQAWRQVFVAYAFALVVALFAGLAAPTEHPLGVALVADLAATVVIFAWSLAHRNSSFYDAYWSVAPIPIALYWILVSQGAVGARQALVLLLVVVWGARLTWNWARGWRGLEHEDWRYVDLQRRTGRLYWIVSLLGIHAMPTLWVFGGMLGVHAAVCVPGQPLGPVDAIATLVTGGAIALEARADHELRRFRDAHPAPGEFLRTGLWAWSRHPNYLGEIAFWWGLWSFGAAAAPDRLWTLAGPIGITLMFLVVSLPMIETRMRERRPGWAEWAARSSLLLPRPPRP